MEDSHWRRSDQGNRDRFVQRARENTLTTFSHSHQVRYNDIIEKRINAMKSAHPLTNDPGVIDPNQLLVKGLVHQLKSLMEAIAEHDQESKNPRSKNVVLCSP